MLEGIGAILFCVLAFFAFGIVFSYVSKYCGSYSIVISLFIVFGIGFVLFHALVFISNHWFIFGVIVGLIVGSFAGRENGIIAGIITMVVLFTINCMLPDQYREKDTRPKITVQRKYTEDDNPWRKKEKDQSQSEENSSVAASNENPEYWKKSRNNDVYIFGSFIRHRFSTFEWDGNYIQDGDYKYADGFGIIKGYMFIDGDMKLVDIVEGNVKRGKLHGKYKRKNLPNDSSDYLWMYEGIWLNGYGVKSELPEGKNWIKSTNNNAYIWNPSPVEDETVEWSGDYIEENGYRYAEGAGQLTWYRNGKAVQIDEGILAMGKHLFKFTHKFLDSGKVEYSYWNDKGEEIDKETLYQLYKVDINRVYKDKNQL